MIRTPLPRRSISRLNASGAKARAIREDAKDAMPVAIVLGTDRGEREPAFLQ